MRPIILAFIITLASCASPELNQPDDRNDTGKKKGEQPPSAPQAMAEQSIPSPEGLAGAPLDPAYIGRWNGSKGTFLVVTDPPRGGMMLTFTVDGKERQYPGSVTAEGLRFMRDGTAEAAILLAGPNGEEHACLSVREGESYCQP